MQPTPLHIPHWYIPSFYGDIRLEPVNTKSCRLIAEKTTEREKTALGKLAEVASKKRWLPTSSPTAPKTSLFSNDGALKTTLEAPIDKVVAQLAKLLKPNRKIISAVRFADGMIEEVFGEPDENADNVVTSRTSRPGADQRVHKRSEKTATAAASVAAPTRGCPAPDFASAELKAKGVLATFLTPSQLDDFARYNRFVSTGAATGHHYMITSRQAKDQIADYQRTMFDLDEHRPLCVHDWSVPAAEEMLSLHLLLQMPEWERYLRSEEHDVEMNADLWASIH